MERFDVGIIVPTANRLSVGEASWNSWSSGPVAIAAQRPHNWSQALSFGALRADFNCGRPIQCASVEATRRISSHPPCPAAFLLIA